MVEEILDRMEENGKVKLDAKKIITILIFAFGVCLFLSGYYFGDKMRYEKFEEEIIWYSEHCMCSENKELIWRPDIEGFG